MEEERQVESKVLDQLKEWLGDIVQFFTEPLGLGRASSLSLWDIIFFITCLVLLYTVSGKIRTLLVKRILIRYNMDIGIREIIGTITRYIIMVLGLLVIIQTAGVDLSALGLLAGALGVGIGFGLQNITSNFISGIIILFERPIKVGDRIEVGDVTGNVVDISARATTVVTNDNIAIIVPNSDFISSKVINWSYRDRTVRFNFPVGVSYNEEPERIKKLLLEVARENTGVLNEPPPDVLFDGFGDSSLNFNLRVWTRRYTDTPRVLKSQLYYAIAKKFRENGVEIPFPQRDLHLRSGFDQLASSAAPKENGSSSTER
ncbi:Mechanosensitive ion channel [Catalinimonas alkaloidigena]|uniref:Mechanosensitive ion channel n=1 Tax=Catalinimonas alkaloidigena TaxID=1075417 RepID=A0A1G9IMY6_9BACT|nr:mechanosensitive ion channel domain-containing protein [Catalinimonas alkaloidigena]SDL26512.1 Mechanosensitive ion channel [Catalinimonas alkaloidigena]